MKIVLNSVEDLRELIGVLDAEFLRTWQPGLRAPVFESLVPPTVDSDWAPKTPGQIIDDIEHMARTLEGTPGPTSTTNEPGPIDVDAMPAEDSDGAPHNTDWHSDPAKINADGTWRARRKRDEAAYKDWLLSLAVEQAEATFGTFEAEPVATETHALPQDESSINVTLDGEALAAPEPETAPTEDHTALIEASQEAAKDAPDGTIDLLNAGKEFIKEYGTAKFEALKSAVCPTDDGKGKAIPSMVPAERRLMRACMDNYALYL